VLAGRKDARPRTCGECGKVFIPEYGNKQRIYCGPRCKHKHLRRVAAGTRRARILTLPREVVDPFRVFERDGWCCRECGTPTPREKRGTIAPDAPELDHTIPLAKGGSHTYRNTRLTCRACNNKKSDRLAS
jgi:5-methylcytosine-specific restriction endonuclease McrA